MFVCTRESLPRLRSSLLLFAVGDLHQEVIDFLLFILDGLLNLKKHSFLHLLLHRVFLELQGFLILVDLLLDDLDLGRVTHKELHDLLEVKLAIAILFDSRKLLPELDFNSWGTAPDLAR